ADDTIKGPIAPGKCVEKTSTLTGFPTNRIVLVYGMVDPLDEIDECASKNNVAPAPDTFLCQDVQ
ncbi:MAG TPA: hypothetical protein VHM19_22345, partial [Polyangiales bacterium]|nr:hypothetical protein [Polyangiales bacterium]